MQLRPWEKMLRTVKLWPSWKRSAASLFTLFLCGILGLKGLEGPRLSWSDCAYLSLSTTTTVGLGDVFVVTPHGKMFICVYALLGCATFARSPSNPYATCDPNPSPICKSPPNPNP